MGRFWCPKLWEEGDSVGPPLNSPTLDIQGMYQTRIGLTMVVRNDCHIHEDYTLLL